MGAKWTDVIYLWWGICFCLSRLNFFYFVAHYWIRTVLFVFTTACDRFFVMCGLPIQEWNVYTRFFFNYKLFQCTFCEWEIIVSIIKGLFVERIMGSFVLPEPSDSLHKPRWKSNCLHAESEADGNIRSDWDLIMPERFFKIRKGASKSIYSR